jgi:hypothetical protein
MTFNPDNFRREDDSILDLPTENGSVKDDLQDIRNEHAKALRDIRKERDENRREGLNDEADELQNKTRNKKHVLFRVARPEQNRKVLDNATGKVFESFDNLRLSINSDDRSKFSKLLGEMSKDDIEILLDSNYKNSSANVLLAMQRIGEKLNQHGLLRYRDKKIYSGFVQEMLIKGARGDGKMYEKKEALELLGDISYDIEPEDKKIIRNQVDKNLNNEKFTKLFLEGEQGKRTIESLIDIGSTVAIESISNVVKEVIKPDSNFDMKDTLSHLIWGYEDRQETTRLIIEIVGRNLEEEFNIKDGVEVVKRWKGKDSISILSNLFSLRNIEKDRPGGAKLLNESYGICEFNRYPTEMMIDQIDNHDKDVPYGAVFFPAEDESDAFDQNKEVLKQLYDGTKGRHISRVFEVDEKSSFARFLVTLRLKYKHKIDFMILVAHGEKYGLRFSWKSRLNKDIVNESTSIDSIKEMMTDEPSIALISCSTGAEDGFAQIASYKLEARVQAPIVDTVAESLSVRYEGDKPILNVKFRDDQREYLNGILVK